MLLSALLEAIPAEKRGFAAPLIEAASDPLSHSDIRSALSDQLDDMHPGQCCVNDVFGDDSSGDVVYSQYDPKSGSHQMFKAPYALGTTNGKRTAEIDEDSKTNVVPRTTYEEEADDDDSMVSMEAERKKAKLYTALPAYERFISKTERNAADSSDFAGKGKSFPILKPGDVMAAVHSMGRAGSDNVGTSTLKKNIIAIAKRKGWTKYLPKAWQGGSESSNSNDNSNTSEAYRAALLKLVYPQGTVRLCETSVASLERIELKEARADYPIKLIAPGAGSSAFYPKEVLQRDGPKVFKAGTHVYLNHPTAAEEAARPEGDVRNLAGVLTTDAAYQESHPSGPGLYARMKVFADHARTVEEKAPHVGMSIRASGKAESGQKKNGLPVLTELTSAESVDVVTRAGAGGMILQESAAGAANLSDEVDNMTKEELSRLVESAVASGTRPLRERLLKADATAAGMRLLEGLAIPGKAKELILENVIGDGSKLPTIDGELDDKKFRESLDAEAKRIGAVLGEVAGSGRVLKMGAGEPTKQQLKEAKQAKKEAKESRKEARRLFESLGLPADAAKFAARGREDAA
jgi:hypothetical protein